VPAENRKFDPAQLPTVVNEIEAISPSLAPHVGSYPIRLFVLPKSLDPAASRGSDTLPGRITPGHNQATIRWQQGRKSSERRYESFAGIVTIKMIGLNIQDYRIVGAKVQEILTEFASFDENRVPISCPTTLAPVSRRGAIDYRRIAARGHKDFGGHCRGGRLAMGSGDGQAAVHLHQLAKHFGIAPDWNAEFGSAT